MDWGDRVAIRRHIRAQMRARNLLSFCDDEHQDNVAGTNREDVWPLEPPESRARSLLSEGVAASTTDHELQSISNTITPDSEFWSSSGSPHQATEEGLLFALSSPACCVKSVTIAIYRAHYQHGDPLYPPEAVSFMLGPSPTQMYPASPRYPCKRTEDEQVFSLYRNVPVAGYLLVRLHGKLQQQWEDMQYYLAIRYVAAHGTSLAPHEIPSLLSGLAAKPITWHTCWASPDNTTAPLGAKGQHKATAGAEQQDQQGDVDMANGQTEAGPMAIADAGGLAQRADAAGAVAADVRPAQPISQASSMQTQGVGTSGQQQQQQPEVVCPAQGCTAHFVLPPAHVPVSMRHEALQQGMAGLWPHGSPPQYEDEPYNVLQVRRPLHAPTDPKSTQGSHHEIVCSSGSGSSGGAYAPQCFQALGGQRALRRVGPEPDGLMCVGPAAGAGHRSGAGAGTGTGASTAGCSDAGPESGAGPSSSGNAHARAVRDARAPPVDAMGGGTGAAGVAEGPEVAMTLSPRSVSRPASLLSNVTGAVYNFVASRVRRGGPASHTTVQAGDAPSSAHPPPPPSVVQPPQLPGDTNPLQLLQNPTLVHWLLSLQQAQAHLQQPQQRAGPSHAPPDATQGLTATSPLSHEAASEPHACSKQQPRDEPRDGETWFEMDKEPVECVCPWHTATPALFTWPTSPSGCHSSSGSDGSWAVYEYDNEYQE